VEKKHFLALIVDVKPTVVQTESPFSLLEQRRLKLQRLIGLQALKEAYWVLADSLEQSEAEDTEILQEEAMRQVSLVLGTKGQEHAGKILALLLSDIMHFSQEPTYDTTPKHLGEMRKGSN
jgi:hypothetical protein